MARPIAYDREQVVAAAARKFWEGGFDGCDIDTLTRSSGLNRHSLYKAFGGKNGLFLDALRFYVEKVAHDYVTTLEGSEGLDGIVSYFELATGVICDAKGYDGRGCLITNTVIELGRSNRAVSDIVDRYYARIERAFADLIRRGQDDGTIRRGLDPQATAQWLRLTSQGMSVSARNGAVPADLANIVRAALAEREERPA